MDRVSLQWKVRLLGKKRNGDWRNISMHGFASFSFHFPPAWTMGRLFQCRNPLNEIKVLFPDFVRRVCRNFTFWLFCTDLVAK